MADVVSVPEATRSHSSLPWYCERAPVMSDDGHSIYRDDPRGHRELIADVWDSDDAAFIVRACNSRDDLLAALKAACGYMKNAVIDLQTGTKKQTTLDTLSGGLRIAEAAIAKAESR